MCMCVCVHVFKSFLTNQHNLYESKLQMYIFLGKNKNKKKSAGNGGKTIYRVCCRIIGCNVGIYKKFKCKNEAASNCLPNKWGL